MRSRVKRPALRYFGGKFRMASWIIEHLPPHECYVEPYGGAMSVLLSKAPAPVDVYNDLAGEIVNFFKVLREQPDKLIRAIDLTPYARQEYQQSREATTDLVEWARRTYVKSWQSFGMKTRGSGWRYVMDGNRGTQPVDDWSNTQHLWAIAERLKQVQIECDEAINVMRRFDREKTLFYLDPPYVKDTRYEKYAYAHEMNDEQHRELAKVLHDLDGMVVLSGYPSELYDELYAGWKVISKNVATTRNGELAEERLWFSPNAARAAKQMTLLRM